jgi:hypothetical protein
MAFETQAIFSPLESIIWFHTIDSIEEWNDNLKNYCLEKKIDGYLLLKDYLINKTFRNFSNECFDSIYQNSWKVAWRISDKQVLDDFLQIPNIDDKIETLSIEWWEHNHFSYMFRFKKWEIMNNNIKLEIWDTYSF